MEICATLEAMAGVGVETMAARGLAHGHGLKPGGLDEHVLCLGGDHRVPPAHDTSQANGLDVVGNDQVFGIESALNAVESLELFTLARAPNDDAALKPVEIKYVRRLPH